MIQRGQAGADGVQRSLGAAGDAQLAEDVADVSLDGTLADHQLLGDLLDAFRRTSVAIHGSPRDHAAAYAHRFYRR